MAKSQTFKSKAKAEQIEWRKGNISSRQQGTYGIDKNTGLPKLYEHIIPKSFKEEIFWSEIRTELKNYLRTGIKPHTGTNNLLSSWAVCANLYFPIRCNDNFKKLMLAFLKLKVSSEITELNELELEFSFPSDDPLHPHLLLGEIGGSRGAGQTSPDIAFKVKTNKGDGIILTECKYTEHSFYACSARKSIAKTTIKDNGTSSICMKSAIENNYKSNCHHNPERKYWTLLNLSDFGKQYLKRCPAATSGYQLFRQQALAEGIMNSGKYSLVASTVAFDNRNSVLINSLKLTGLSDFQTDWEKIFESKTIFKTWHHQEWVKFVRNNNDSGLFDDWLQYLQHRYKY